MRPNDPDGERRRRRRRCTLERTNHHICICYFLHCIVNHFHYQCNILVEVDTIPLPLRCPYWTSGAASFLPRKPRFPQTQHLLRVTHPIEHLSDHRTSLLTPRRLRMVNPPRPSPQAHMSCGSTSRDAGQTTQAPPLVLSKPRDPGNFTEYGEQDVEEWLLL